MIIAAKAVDITICPEGNTLNMSPFRKLKSLTFEPPKKV